MTISPRGRAQIVDERVILHAGCVELPEGDLLAVRTPLKSIANGELFFVHPVGSSVDNIFGAVISELGDFSDCEIFHVDIIFADVTDF